MQDRLGLIHMEAATTTGCMHSGLVAERSKQIDSNLRGRVDQLC